MPQVGRYGLDAWCEFLQVSRDHLNDLVKRHRIPFKPIGRGDKLIDAVDMNHYLPDEELYEPEEGKR